MNYSATEDLSQYQTIVGSQEAISQASAVATAQIASLQGDLSSVEDALGSASTVGTTTVNLKADSKIGGHALGQSHELVSGSSINAGIYKYINFKEIPALTHSLIRYDFFRIPRISGVVAHRTMYLTISTEYNNEGAKYQEHIVTWNDSAGEILSVSATQHLTIGALPVSIQHNSAPAMIANNQAKIWIWEDNNNVYVSFINMLQRSHRILIQMKLFNLKDSNGGTAVVL